MTKQTKGFKFKVDRRQLAQAKVREAAVAGLTDATEWLLEQANRTVPIEEATLDRSGQATVDSGALRGCVSYDTPYAVRQHEDTRLHHDSGRRAKWLEKTFEEDGAQAAEFVAERIRQVTG